MNRVAIGLVVFAVIVIAAGLAIGLALGLPKMWEAEKEAKDKECEDKGGQGGGGGGEEDKYKSSTGTYRFASVAVDHGPCSEIGADILGRQGGSTVDAMIASFLCNGVVNSQHMGVGGGVLMVIYEKPRPELGLPDEKELKAIIGRETAPKTADPYMYASDTSKQKSGVMSIAVPGEINAYYKAWERYGLMEWKDLFQPAIKMCREGWKVSASMAVSIDDQKDLIYSDPMWKELLVKADNTTYKEGDLIKNARYADTLEKIANDPTGKTFYTGTLADEIVQDITNAGGSITKEDLASNEAIIYDPLTVHLDNGDFDVYTPPPPASGVIIEFVLKLMDGYNYNKDKFKTTEDKVLFYHRMVEAFKFGFGRRTYLGDKDKNDDNINAMLDKLLDPTYIEKMRKLVKDDGTYDVAEGEYDPELEDQLPQGGTSHAVFLGAEGAAVSATSTVGSLWGCKVKCRGSATGVIFNNGMELFSLPSSTNTTANWITATKRGRSSTSPILILNKDKEVAFLVGGSGGARIVTASSLIAMLSLWMDVDVRDALDGPRFHHQLDKADTLYYDEAMAADIVSGMAAKGHSNMVPGLQKYPYLGVEQAIDNRDCLDGCDGKLICTHKCIKATCDWRKGGYPDGV